MSRTAGLPDEAGGRKMQGKKTHEQQVRILERNPDQPDARELDQALGREPAHHAGHQARAEARQSEFPVSRTGLNQENDHNKHNDPGQSGHKPQKSSTSQQNH
jgi:hypothetical protein